MNSPINTPRTASAPGIAHDNLAWPLVRVSMHGDYPTAALTAHIAEVEKCLTKDEPFVMAIDVRAGRGVTATERKMFAELMKRRSADIKKHLVRVAVISDSVLHRGGLTALTWIVPMPIDLKFFAEPNAAERWLREGLR